MPSGQVLSRTDGFRTLPLRPAPPHKQAISHRCHLSRRLCRLDYGELRGEVLLRLGRATSTHQVQPCDGTDRQRIVRPGKPCYTPGRAARRAGPRPAAMVPPWCRRQGIKHGRQCQQIAGCQPGRTPGAGYATADRAPSTAPEGRHVSETCCAAVVSHR